MDIVHVPLDGRGCFVHAEHGAATSAEAATYESGVSLSRSILGGRPRYRRKRSRLNGANWHRGAVKKAGIESGAAGASMSDHSCRRVCTHIELSISKFTTNAKTSSEGRTPSTVHWVRIAQYRASRDDGMPRSLFTSERKQHQMS